MPLNQAFAVRKVKVRGEQATVETVIPTQTPTTLRLRKVERSVLRGLAPGPPNGSSTSSGRAQGTVYSPVASRLVLSHENARPERSVLARVALAPQERL
jgi:hypothetical protein